MEKQILAVYRKEQKSLADAPDYQALVNAITDPTRYTGQVIQAVFDSPGGILRSNPVKHLPDAVAQQLSQYGELPLYSMAVLADRQEGQMQVALLALLYPDLDSARQAVAELAKRTTGLGIDPEIGKLYKLIGARIDPPYIFAGNQGSVVAVLSVRYPTVISTLDEMSKDRNLMPAVVFRAWLQGLYRQAFYLPVPGALRK